MEDQNKDYPIGYMPQIDGVRGILPFGVLAAHIQYSWFPGAIVFMDIFFILSAYLITILLLKDIGKYEKIRFKIFYARRFLRLFPPYYAMLACFFLATTLILPDPWPHYKDILFAGLYISNWIRALAIETPDWLGHTWSLSIEEQYYLFWPIILTLLVRFLGTGRHLILTLAAFYIFFNLWRYGLADAGRSIVRLYNGTDTRADTLLVGCILAIMRVSQERVFLALARVCRRILLPSFLLIFFVLGFTVNWQERSVYTWGTTCIDIIVAVFLTGLLTSSGTIVHRLFENRILVSLGKLSYATYLWHYPIFHFVRHFHGGDWAVVFIGVPMTYFFAWFSGKYIERPCMLLKRRFV